MQRQSPCASAVVLLNSTHDLCRACASSILTHQRATVTLTPCVSSETVPQLCSETVPHTSDSSARHAHQRDAASSRQLACVSAFAPVNLSLIHI